MSEHNISDSETREDDSDSSSEEIETPRNGATQKLSDYEKQRLKRIEDNKARMEALGLHKMASSLMGSVRTTRKNKQKGKRKLAEEDEEYRPPEGDEGLSPSSEGEDDDDSDEFVGGKTSRSRLNKAKKRNSTSKEIAPVRKPLSNSGSVDDDDALMQAIALSLQDSVGFLDVGSSMHSQSSGSHVRDGMVNERKGIARMQEDTGKRKRQRKKLINSRVQITEDELVMHFFQFDEAGKGSITLRDLWRVAAAHDFTWTDKEMADMIYYFDSDGDGKLSLEDFRKIAGRCKMMKGS